MTLFLAIGFAFSEYLSALQFHEQFLVSLYWQFQYEEVTEMEKTQSERMRILIEVLSARKSYFKQSPARARAHYKPMV